MTSVSVVLLTVPTFFMEHYQKYSCRQPALYFWLEILWILGSNKAIVLGAKSHAQMHLFTENEVLHDKPKFQINPVLSAKNIVVFGTYKLCYEPTIWVAQAFQLTALTTHVQTVFIITCILTGSSNNNKQIRWFKVIGICSVKIEVLHTQVTTFI